LNKKPNRSRAAGFNTQFEQLIIISDIIFIVDEFNNRVDGFRILLQTAK